MENAELFADPRARRGVRRRYGQFGLDDLRRILLIGDLATAALASWAAPNVVEVIDRTYVPNSGVVAWQVISPLVWVFTMWLLGAGDVSTPRFGRRSLSTVTQTFVTVAFIVFVTFFLAPFFAPRSSTLATLPLIAAAVLLWRSAYLRLLGSRVFDRRVAIIGSDDAARRAAEAIERSSGRPYRLVAVIGLSHVPARGVVVLSADCDLWRVVADLSIDQIVVGHTKTLPQTLLSELVRCFEQGVETVPATSLYEQLTGRVMASALEADWYAELPTHAYGLYPILKRVVDVVIGSALGLLAMPAMLIIATAIFVDSGWPIMLRQRRVGRRGEEFVLHKFRTMRPNAEPDGRPVWASKNDNRTTRVGRYLRRLRLDELPQLWDVVRGKMSLIGPRPERPQFAERLATELPLYRARGVVRPGITGWAQVQFPYAGSIADNLSKLEYDLYYLRHFGLALDLSVALRTIATILRFDGR